MGSASQPAAPREKQGQEPKMTTRQQIIDISRQVSLGERGGDKIAAFVAINEIAHQTTLDVLGITISDEEMNARIVAAVKAAKETGTYNGAPIHV
jgi:hypothetical protein